MASTEATKTGSAAETQRSGTYVSPNGLHITIRANRAGAISEAVITDSKGNTKVCTPYSSLRAGKD